MHFVEQTCWVAIYRPSAVARTPPKPLWVMPRRGFCSREGRDAGSQHPRGFQSVPRLRSQGRTNASRHPPSAAHGPEAAHVLVMLFTKERLRGAALSPGQGRGCLPAFRPRWLRTRCCMSKEGASGCGCPLPQRRSWASPRLCKCSVLLAEGENPVEGCKCLGQRSGP